MRRKMHLKQNSYKSVRNNSKRYLSNPSSNFLKIRHCKEAILLILTERAWRYLNCRLVIGSYYYINFIPYTKREMVDCHHFLKLCKQLIREEVYWCASIVANVV